ncbi:hypothetical protein DPMN_107159 [Dreissena polymorpha]|uniref:Uncharacterized protein n=1 Tax=Dreissena polymorpha TaxID=45954 RepID=A0A9D4K688_DREPO|nr:hypothetical protein DPMN_107159 [Dreissena polymorpha]
MSTSTQPVELIDSADTFEGIRVPRRKSGRKKRARSRFKPIANAADINKTTAVVLLYIGIMRGLMSSRRRG